MEDIQKVTRLCTGCLHDGVLERTLERAEAAEAKLAEVRHRAGAWAALAPADDRGLTPGQVAFEAYRDQIGGSRPWSDVRPLEREVWEAVGATVAEAALTAAAYRAAP